MKSFVNVILYDHRGRILLQQRDNNPAIYYPGHWGIFGGQIEENESPIVAAIREITEELNYVMTHCTLIKKFTFDSERIDYLLTELHPMQLSDVKLSEGSGMKLFTHKSIGKIEKIVPYDKAMLDYCLTRKPYFFKFLPTS